MDARIIATRGITGGASFIATVGRYWLFAVAVIGKQVRFQDSSIAHQFVDASIEHRFQDSSITVQFEENT